MKINMLPITKSFQLKTDPDGRAMIVINQAREGESILRDDMFSRVTRVFGGDPLGLATSGQRIQIDNNYRRVRRREAYITLASISGIVDNNESELFRSATSSEGTWVRGAMTETEFNRVWDSLPDEVVDEIHGYILEVNPQWDPDPEAQKNSSPTSSEPEKP